MSANASEFRVSGNWHNRGLLVALGLVAVVLFLYPTYAEIVHFWWTYSAYNHCILIVPISLFLAYEKREALLSFPPTTSWIGAAYVLFNCLAWLTGGFLAIAAVQHAAAIGILIGLFWALIGNARARIIAFPLLYLYFGVPEGEVLVPYLRDLTAEVVVNLLRATGIPVFLEGRYLTIPSGQFHVAKACSGINYLIATLAVGTVFAYTRYVSNYRRAGFMVLAIAVPLIANGLRAYGIVMIAHLSDYKYAIGIDHYIYGWVFFGIVIFILFAVGNTFSDRSAKSIEPIADRKTAFENPTNKSPLFVFIFIVLSVVVCKAIYFRTTVTPDVRHNYVIKVNDPWRLTNEGRLNLFGSYAGKPIHLKGEYLASAKQNAIIGLEMILYLNPNEHGELENRANLFFDEEQWQRLSGPDEISPGVRKISRVHEYILRRYGQQHVVWTWFDIDGEIVLDRNDAKWALLKSRLKQNYQGGAQIIVVTPDTENIAHSRETLTAFLRESMPSMQNYRVVPD